MRKKGKKEREGGREFSVSEWAYMHFILCNVPKLVLGESANLFKNKRQPVAQWLRR